MTIGDHHSFDDPTLGTLMEAHIGALDVAPGAYLSGHAQTLGGGQMSDTMKAIDIVAKLRVIDEMLAEQGVPMLKSTFISNLMMSCCSTMERALRPRGSKERSDLRPSELAST